MSRDMCIVVCTPEGYKLEPMEEERDQVNQIHNLIGSTELASLMPITSLRNTFIYANAVGSITNQLSNIFADPFIHQTQLRRLVAMGNPCGNVAIYNENGIDLDTMKQACMSYELYRKKKVEYASRFFEAVDEFKSH